MSDSEDLQDPSVKTFEEALFNVVFIDDVNELDWFVSLGFDLTHSDRQLNILHASSAWNKPKTLKRCIEYGFDINEPDQTWEKKMLLVYALLRGDKDNMEILIDAGADLNV